MDIHIRTGALSPAFSFSSCVCVSLSLFCYLSFGYLYRIVFCLCTLELCMVHDSRSSVCKPIFRIKIRYDTLLMLHFRFATRMTASIWLCLATNTHTIQSITFPSHFFCCSVRVFHCRMAPNILYLSISNITERHMNTERDAEWASERIEGCRSLNLSLAYFLSFQ